MKNIFILILFLMMINIVIAEDPINFSVDPQAWEKYGLGEKDKITVNRSMNIKVSVLNGTLSYSGSECNVTAKGVELTTDYDDGYYVTSYFTHETIGQKNATANCSHPNGSIVSETIYYDIVSYELYGYECPDDSIQSVFLFAFLYFILITVFLINEMIMKLPFVNIIIGVAIIIFSFIIFSCHHFVGYVGFAFGLGAIIMNFME